MCDVQYLNDLEYETTCQSYIKISETKVVEVCPKVRDGKIARRLKHLITANQYFAEMESLEELLPRMLTLAKSVTEAEAASLLLYRPEHNNLEFAAVADEILQEHQIESLKSCITVRLGEGISGWVAEHREPIMVADVQHDPRFLKVADNVTGFITRNIMSVPLLYGDTLLGVLNVLNAKGGCGFDGEDRELLTSYASLAATAIIRSKLIKGRLRQQRMDIQLTAAAKIQSLFWPKIPRLGNGSHVAAVSLPATAVGGDLYDFIPLSDGSWVIYVADVSDKGLPAALIMVALWSQIRADISLYTDVEKLLESVNCSMYDLLSEEGFFATILLGRYWPESGRLHLAGGGHLPPLRTMQQGTAHLIKLGGIALGIVKQAHYTKKELYLSPGDSILFVTDGVTEAMNVNSELFGENQMMGCVEQLPHSPYSDGLLEAVQAWQGTEMQNDDLTILEIRRDLD